MTEDSRQVFTAIMNKGVNGSVLTEEEKHTCNMYLDIMYERKELTDFRRAIPSVAQVKAMVGDE